MLMTCLLFLLMIPHIGLFTWDHLLAGRPKHLGPHPPGNLANHSLAFWVVDTSSRWDFICGISYPYDDGGFTVAFHWHMSAQI